MTVAPDSASQATSLGAGTIVAGRYELRQFLGAGGFAQVFEAFDRNVERPVAMKFLNLHASGTLPEDAPTLLKRFRREATLTGRLRHPCIINVFDIGEFGDDGQMPYIVMELLDGQDLDQVILADGPLAPDEALPMFVDALEALGEAHHQGIVHKDLKPSNLFVERGATGQPKLRIMDFGVAHLAGPGDGRLTRTGVVLGTPKYMPPEYINEQLVVPAYDVYQMGLILAEALTGEPVVQSKGVIGYILAHKNGELHLPDRLMATALGPVLEQALALDHTRRFADASAFARALAAVDPATVAAAPPSATVPVDAPGPGPADVDAEAAPALDAAKTIPIDTSGPALARKPMKASLDRVPTGAVVPNPSADWAAASPPEPSAPRRASWPAWLVAVAIIGALALAVGGAAAGIFLAETLLDAP